MSSRTFVCLVTLSLLLLLAGPNWILTRARPTAAERSDPLVPLLHPAPASPAEQATGSRTEEIDAVLASAKRVVAGGSHTCVVTNAGGAKCWGSNNGGQLGDGTTNNRYAPVDVNGLASGVAAVASGYVHTCAVTSAGGLKCWGRNDFGQLGDGTTQTRYAPADVNGMATGVSAVAGGTYHTCAVTTAGGVKCWGSNSSGQLGDGSGADQYAPVDVSGLGSGVAAVTAGIYHTCALTKGGGVKCWGYNYHGQLGDGTTTNRITPVDVLGLETGVAAVQAGANHTCALTKSGGVKCWGRNDFGQLGDGSTDSHLAPVSVSGLTSGVVAVAAGGTYDGGHTCAVTNTGGVKCWGNNGSGQLGDGTTTSRHTPVGVSGLALWGAGVAAGGYHTCALVTDGGVKCWGNNNSGQLGDGTTYNHLTPVEALLVPFDCSSWATPTPRPPFTGALPDSATVAQRVSSCVDDTYVRVDTGELLYQKEYVRMGAREGGTIAYMDGLLFRDVRVPRGAAIKSAHLHLQPQGYQSGTPIKGSIAGALDAHSEDFSPENEPAHVRSRTAARVLWTLPGSVSAAVDSPDISDIVEEIVALPDWTPGNNLAILIDPVPGGAHFIDWKAYELSPSEAAELVLDYVAPAATSTPTATDTPSPTPTETLTPTPTATPAVSPAPTATPTDGARPTWLPMIQQG